MVSTIEEVVEIAKKTILRRIRPLSVLLIGSFGRDEGSILCEEGKRKLLRDLDILVVVKRRVSSSEMLSINRIVNTLIGSSYSSNSYLYRHFVVTIFQIPLEELLFWNDIKAYDIKHASKLIWGDDIRERIAINNPDELSSFSAVRLLLNKYVGLCQLSPLTHWDNGGNADLQKVKVMECAKTYIEIGTAACILEGKYAPSYKRRMDIIDREIQRLPHRLRDRILTFTELKLDPSLHKDSFSLDTEKLWFETREDLNDFFLETSKKAYGLDWTGDWPSYVDVWVQRMRRQALLPHFDFYLKRRWRISSIYVCHLLNFAYERYFSYRVFKELQSLAAPALMLRTNPLFEIYGSAILLANSVNRDFTVNRNYILAFMNRQQKMVSIKSLHEYEAHVKRELNNTILFSHCANLLSGMWNAIQRAFYGA